MTITNGYATLSELKHANRLNILSSDTDGDEMLEGIIEAVSRHIDDVCGRRFYSDSSEVDRYYTAKSGTYLFVDDIASPSSDVDIETDTNGDGTMDDTWAGTDFVLAPYTAGTPGMVALPLPTYKKYALISSPGSWSGSWKSAGR